VTSKQQADRLIFADFLFGLFLSPEDGARMLL
jgi:hypothetical protein